MEKDFRFTPDPADVEAQRQVEIEAERIAMAQASPVQPVTFHDKPVYPESPLIKYTDDGRPLSPRYDEPVEPEESIEDEPAPKGSSALEPASTFSSSSSETASVPGLEDVLSESQEPTVPVEKVSGQLKEPKSGTPTSLPSVPTPPGSPTPPA